MVTSELGSAGGNKGNMRPRRVRLERARHPPSDRAPPPDIVQRRTHHCPGRSSWIPLRRQRRASPTMTLARPAVTSASSDARRRAAPVVAAPGPIAVAQREGKPQPPACAGLARGQKEKKKKKRRPAAGPRTPQATPSHQPAAAHLGRCGGGGKRGDHVRTGEHGRKTKERKKKELRHGSPRGFAGHPSLSHPRAMAHRSQCEGGGRSRQVWRVRAVKKKQITNRDPLPGHADHTSPLNTVCSPTPP